MVLSTWLKFTVLGVNMKKPKFKIPQEAADSITVANLVEWRDYLQSELEKWGENPKDDDNITGYWLHPDDVVLNEKYIRACNLIIGAFGGQK